MEIKAETRQTSTLDHADVSRFETMAREWWDEGGKFRALHAFNPVRISFILEEVQRSWPNRKNNFYALENLSVLDIGCGGGILSEPLARLGAAVTGVDPVDAAIRAAQNHAMKQGLDITYRAGTAENLAQENKTFDIIIASEVIEHVVNVPLFLNVCRALAKPSGLIVITTLNRTAKSYALAIIGAEYVLGLIPRGTHEWRKFIKPEELDLELKNARFASLRKLGVIYNPLTSSFNTSASDLSVNYMLSAQAS